MKILKSILISSNGSYYFSNLGEILLSNKLIVLKKQDDKNFSFNQKKKQAVIDSKQSSYYKKKYLKWYLYISGVSPSGKAIVFGTIIQRFESFYSNLLVVNYQNENF